MHISYMSLNRLVERRAAEDEAYRQTLEQNHRPLLSHGRAMSDEALLAKLQTLGLDADRERLLRNFPRFTSAQEMAEVMIARTSTTIPAAQTDWVWIALTCLWERWRSDLANTEMVDDKMQAGYAALADRDSPKACRLWLDAWRAILDIMARSGTDSLDRFDAHFGGTQSVFNWVQDLEMELHNAGLEQPQFFRERIALCETMITRFSGGSLGIENFKTALAQSHFELGDREAGDRLFRRWLDERPQWGGGWMAWSGCYWSFAAERNKDVARAEEILKEGLATPGVANRRHLLERLLALCEESGRIEEATALRQEIKQTPDPRRTATIRREPDATQIERPFDFVEESLPLEPLRKPATSLASAPSASGEPFERQVKVGRNEPCPCGSGKKYKKCCGRPGVSGSNP